MNNKELNDITRKQLLSHYPLIPQLVEEIHRSLTSLTDNFCDFKDKEKLLEAMIWQGFLIGDIHARFQVLKEELKRAKLIDEE